MSAPTPKQRAYLSALITRAGMTQEQWMDTVGLREHSPWGVRVRSELITRARMSVWISDLVAKCQTPAHDAGNRVDGAGSDQEGAVS